ncbi:MAG TPA: ABC transporter substrate-binding protein [Gaiellaceae bacterium]|jgi:peptide/nickel transport system substrate-binding protein
MQWFGSERRGTRGLGVLAAAAIVVLALAACGGSSSSGTNGTTSSAPAQAGGTAYLAEGTQAAPNYIFPFASLQFFSTTNFQGFMNLMYRPLYWFGKGATPDLNLSLSLAGAPKYSNGGRTIKVTMKPYQWSNGEKVTAQQVLFWMNMMKVEKLNWAGYAAGTIPDDLASVTASGNTLTFKLNTDANSNWYTYNELSQITPMPLAWDITKTGQNPQLCGTASYAQVTVKSKTTAKGTTVTPVSAAAKSCAAVYNFLTGEAKHLSTYATNPLWQVVDGPFRLTHFDTTGNVTMVPNKKYSGPVKPKLDKFIELPFTSDEAEFNALAAGKVDVGILPPSDITSNATTTGTCGIKPGQNNPRLADKFNIYAGSTWQINYFPFNFNSTGNSGQSGKLFDQLYFRQAFQTLVNQPVLIQHISKGYGVPTYGPVPVCPENTFAHSEEQLGNPYPYSPSKAQALLKANGWTVKPGGTSVCVSSSKCGVASGTKLNFTLQYVGGSPFEDQLMQAEKSSWAQAGIHVNLTTGTFDTVLSAAVPCSGGSSCSWEGANWGGGWIFAPDYYPSGELLFQTGASSNSGSYSDKRMDTLIKGTTIGNSDLSAYGVYGAKQLPVVWQPITIGATEINKKLQGVLPLNALTNINPENWYFTK